MSAEPTRVGYDDLPEAVQYAVRAQWDKRIGVTLAGLDFTEGLQAVGKPWAEADADGRLVMRGVAAPGR